MANEYLQRTPTSTGNRRVFTWSSWIKKDQISAPARLFSNYSAASTQSAIQFGYREGASTDGAIRFFNIISGSNDCIFEFTPLFRDSSSWFHLLIVGNTTLDNEDDRLIVYVNGVRQIPIPSSYSASSYNVDFSFNTPDVAATTIPTISSASGSGEFFEGQVSDIFYLDGQSLTPDVFGFYKDGNGYVSAGSTQATDFRPGQWVPKRPRIIKTEIERRGGFGVNGFYLPMNDSSNPGADFHCDPNSIITLKGEDLPQPRNGAPTTSDAYVSQLRSDANSANLVLAVPGISTSTSATIVSNGHFDSNTTGWTVGTATGTLVAANGELEIQRVSTNGTYCTQQITTEAGKRYTVSFDTRSSQAGSSYITKFQIGTTPSGNDLLDRIDTDSTTMVHHTASFTATGTTAYVFLGSNYTANSFWDNIVVKQEDAPRDYSADIKGSGSNKTLTPDGGAGVGYELGNYYGSAMTFDGSGDYCALADSSDFSFGSGDFTVEAWIYPETHGSHNNIFSTEDFDFKISSGVIRIYTSSGDSGTVTIPLNQWSHVVVERHNSTITTFVNGVAEILSPAAFTGDGSSAAEIGRRIRGSQEPFDGQIQDLRVYKGVAKYKGGFDVPKPYTPVGIESWRTVADVTANNFATLNPLSYQTTGTYGTSYPVLSDGNLKFTHGQTGQWERSNASFGVGEGKWYSEFQIVSRPTGGTPPNNSENWAVGVRESDSSLFYGETDGFEDLGDHVYWIDANTAKIVSNQDRTAGSTSGISNVVNGDIINIAFEKTATTLKVWFGINGTYFNSGNPSSGTTPAVNVSTTTEYIIPAAAFYQYTGGQVEPVGTFNFGQNPTFSGNTTAGTFTDSNGKGLFKYEPPSGFLALCEDNLPTPAIADPGDYFKTVLYTGDGNAGLNVSGVGFQPDMVWIKNRDSARSNNIYDSVRGAAKRIQPDLTNLESDVAGVSAFNSNGFSLGNGTDDANFTAGENYVAWCWKAGGAAVSNTDGSITSQVSVNQDAGFSIVSYTGTGANATVGHGLGKTPKMIIIKNRGDVNSNTRNWIVYHSAVGATQYLRLNEANAASTLSTVFNDTEPTSSVFSVGTSEAPNENGDSHIAYCWAEIEGFSKFGSYIGNASADGPFVYCGFKPAFVLCKITTTTGSWVLKSNHISTNPNDYTFVPDTNATEYGPANTEFDFLSNGFKIRTGSVFVNTSGATIAFAAFAESPFKTANSK